MDRIVKLSDFDYELPHELIAQHPVPIRDESRLLVLNRQTGVIEHRRFFNIVEYLNRGDVLVLNDTRVIPAKIIGRRKTGARVEALLIRQGVNGNWHAMLNTNAKLRIGEEIIFEPRSNVSCAVGARCNVPLRNTTEYQLQRGEHGALRGWIIDRPLPKEWVIRFEPPDGFLEVLSRLGRMPLPPYIKRAMSNEDRDRYQTVFAQKEGAIAAPTAGLHFTSGLLDKIKDTGVEVVFITLHVGLGTFLPIESDDVEKHVMQREYYEVSEDAVCAVKQAKNEGRRVITTGTTTCRTLETISRGGFEIRSYSGWTDLFIYSPYKFKIVDALITNFHLPKTTLLLLVSAFAGRKEILAAYEAAKREGYRFYSYGDAMFII